MVVVNSWSGTLSNDDISLQLRFLLNLRGPTHAVDFRYMHGMGLASGVFNILLWLVVEPTPLKNMLVKVGSSSPN